MQQIKKTKLTSLFCLFVVIILWDENLFDKIACVYLLLYSGL